MKLDYTELSQGYLVVFKVDRVGDHWDKEERLVREILSSNLDRGRFDVKKLVRIRDVKIRKNLEGIRFHDDRIINSNYKKKRFEHMFFYTGNENQIDKVKRLVPNMAKGVAQEERILFESARPYFLKPGESEWKRGELNRMIRKMNKKY